jgi:hypothetical protein
MAGDCITGGNAVSLKKVREVSAAAVDGTASGADTRTFAAAASGLRTQSRRKTWQSSTT